MMYKKLLCKGVRMAIIDENGQHNEGRASISECAGRVAEEVDETLHMAHWGRAIGKQECVSCCTTYDTRCVTCFRPLLQNRENCIENCLWG